jgi:hypothetical protein
MRDLRRSCRGPPPRPACWPLSHCSHHNDPASRLQHYSVVVTLLLPGVVLGAAGVKVLAALRVARAVDAGASAGVAAGPGEANVRPRASGVGVGAMGAAAEAAGTAALEGALVLMGRRTDAEAADGKPAKVGRPRTGTGMAGTAAARDTGWVAAPLLLMLALLPLLL